MHILTRLPDGSTLQEALDQHLLLRHDLRRVAQVPLCRNVDQVQLGAVHDRLHEKPQDHEHG